MSSWWETVKNKIRPEKPSLKSKILAVLLLIAVIVVIVVMAWSVCVIIVYLRPFGSNYFADLPLNLRLLSFGGAIFSIIIGCIIYASGKLSYKGFFLLSIPSEICHPVYRPYRKVPYICLLAFLLYFIIGKYDPFIEQQSKNLFVPMLTFWAIFAALIPMVNIGWKLEDLNMQVEERKNIISKSIISFFAIPTMSIWIVLLAVLALDFAKVEIVRMPETTSNLLAWLAVGSVGLILYFIFLDIPFCRGQTNRKRINKSKLNEQRKQMLEIVEKLTDPLEIMAIEMKIQRIDRQINKIEAEPEHPFKGMLLIPSVFLSLLISPLVEIILKQLVP